MVRIWDYWWINVRYQKSASYLHVYVQNFKNLEEWNIRKIKLISVFAYLFIVKKTANFIICIRLDLPYEDAHMYGKQAYLIHSYLTSYLHPPTDDEPLADFLTLQSQFIARLSVKLHSNYVLVKLVILHSYFYLPPRILWLQFIFSFWVPLSSNMS